MSRAKKMTEELWLKSRDLTRMFAHLGWPTKLIQDARFRRKSRLFGVAAVRHSWNKATIPPALQRAIDVAEQFADNAATMEELRAIESDAHGSGPFSECRIIVFL